MNARSSLPRWLGMTALAVLTLVGHAQTFSIVKSFGILTNVTGFSPQSPFVEGPDGTLYGTTSEGEGAISGTVFKMQPNGSGFTVLKWFKDSAEGDYPKAGLNLSDGVLYGTTYSGGHSNRGTVFKINTDGTGFQVLKDFSGSSDGKFPVGGLVTSGGVLYGTTTQGGDTDAGTVFKMNTDGTGYTVLRTFGGYPADGGGPAAGLVLSGTVLYGTTSYGGSSARGTVFRLNTDGTGYTLLKTFNGYDGSAPSILISSGGALYGITKEGGTTDPFRYPSGRGTVFKLNTDGTGFAVIRNFYGSDGVSPTGLTSVGDVFYGITARGDMMNPSQPGGMGTVFKMKTDGTGYTVLKGFTSSDGLNPAGPTLSGDVLYGTLSSGGSSGFGLVFKMNLDGSGYSVMKNLAYSDGASPFSGLVSSGSVLYGTTYSGGNLNFGTVFMLKKDGTGYQRLKDFYASDGAWPKGGLVLSGGVLYGTTSSGGSSLNLGTVFRLNSDGTGYTVLKTFGGYPSDGASPTAGLVLSGTALYGTTSGGGSSNAGTVFKLNTDGTGYRILKNFDFSGNGGYSPNGGLTCTGGVLYGTTFAGGLQDRGTLFRLNTDGTGYVVLRSFLGDGYFPVGGLTLSGSVLYGTTSRGGSYGTVLGTVFKMNTDGTGFTILRHFADVDGFYPEGDLVFSGGVLYGTTSTGGLRGSGTVFKMSADGSGYSVLKHFGAYTAADDGGYPGPVLTLSGAALYGTTRLGGTLGEGTVFRIDLPDLLAWESTGSSIVLNWIDPARTLQTAPTVAGDYTNVFGATSPYTNTISGVQQFFRLISN